jgi:hypothetical protein
MSALAGDFLQIALVKIPADSLGKRLVVEQYIERLYQAFADEEGAQKVFRKLAKSEPGLLQEFRSVLMRFENPKKWRDYLIATRERKGLDNLKPLIEMLDAFKQENSPKLPDDHPLEKLNKSVRQSLLDRLEQSFNLDTEELQEWTNFLDTTWQSTRVIAAREWLSVALRRSLDGK